jgi:Na+-translocating ferredoxin:NAD+ oxidoreductase subunit C
MFRRLTQKKMVGGLVFGPPGWMPQRIADTFEAPAAVPPTGDGASAAQAAVSGQANANRPPLPTRRGELISLVENIGLGRTSAVIPALVEQLYELRARPLRTVVLVALPTQPEYVLGPALSHLALADVLAGLEVLSHVLGPRRILVVLDRHDGETFRLWKGAARSRRNRPQLCIKLLRNRYPQAHPTILARTLYGQRLPAGTMPTRIGRLMLDPVACWGLGRYLRLGRPFTDRPVQLITQHGHAPRLVMGRLGETVAAFCKRYEQEVSQQQVILNGMLTGQEVDAGVARIAADTEAVAVREPAEVERPTACLSCGWCVDVCPTALTPVHLMQLAQKVPPGATPKPALLRSTMVRESLHCIACGLCTYVCPTRLPLMEETLRLRNLVLATVPLQQTRGAA